MKRIISWRVSGIIVLALVAALVILLGSVTVAAHPSTDQEASPQTLTVSGVGEASGVPDIATIQLGVEVQNPDPAQALSEANSAIQQVENALQSNGVSQDHIQTANFNMWSSQDNSTSQGSNATSQTSYHVQDILSVTTTIDQAGNLIDAAVAAGANNINGLSFGLADPATLIQQARAQAVTDAQMRAEEIAQMMGVTLGKPVSINENVDNNPGSVHPLAMNTASTPVSAGQLSVTVNIDVSYAISS